MRSRLPPAFSWLLASESISLLGTSISALAIQVFLDTYATEGVRPDLAREALREYAAEAFDARLREPQRRFLLAERGDALLGFAEIGLADQPAPDGGVHGAELDKLPRDAAEARLQALFEKAGVGAAYRIDTLRW